MARNRSIRRGAGFSLYELQDTLRECTDKLAEALASQGVDANIDQLFIELQSVANRVGGNNGYGGMTTVSPILASEEAPYSFSGDIMAIAYQCFQNGEKKDALKLAMQAMDKDDFGDLISGILLMNSKSAINKQAAKIKLKADDSLDEEDYSDESGDDEEDDTTDSNLDENGDLIDPTLDKDGNPIDDEEESDDSDEEELSDSDLEALAAEIDEDALLKELEKEDNTDSDEVDEENKAEKDAEESDEDEEDEVEDLPKAKGAPMGTTTSVKNSPSPTPPSNSGNSGEITASETSRILANKLSLSGSSEDLKKAREFLKKNPNL